MSERIKELAGQTFYWEGDGMFSGQVELEKFAESIVRECIAQVRKDENGPAYEAAGRIAEHFGVEE